MELFPESELECDRPDPELVGKPCANCGATSEGYFGVHQWDQFDDSLPPNPPVVPLCNACGKDPTPTMEEIWKNIDTRLRRENH